MDPSEAKALQPRFLLTCTSCRVVKIGASYGLGTFGLPNVTQENVDPFLQELHSYNYNPNDPDSHDIWTTQDVIDRINNNFSPRLFSSRRKKFIFFKKKIKFLCNPVGII
jgi:hypothetical protein